jgi:outer membrane protein assembly factor BamB
MQSGNERLPPVAGATDRIRLYARPTGGDGPLVIEGDRFFATYFRIVMGFEAHKGQLAWVHRHDLDVLGGDTGNGALVLCDEQGKITILSARSGGVMGEMDMGEPVRACTVQLDDFKPAGAAPNAPPLAQQIAHSVQSHEPQLATGNRFLLRELSTLEDELATKTLVELATDPRASPLLVTDARVALANRRNGARYMIEALGARYDPMAQALAAMNERNAAPALASHLVDPNDTDDDVRQAAEALVVLGGPAEVPTVKQFFGMYRANADTDEIGAAVVSAGQALLKLGGKDGRAVVDQAIADPMTIPAAKERLESIVQQLEPPSSGGDKEPQKEPEKK